MRLGGRIVPGLVPLGITSVRALCLVRKCSAKVRETTIVPLVKRLYDEDAAMRLSAIRALKDITGEDMGYRHYEPEVERVAAIKRWEDWLVKEGLVE